MKHTAISFLETPIGKLKIVGDETAIKLVSFTDEAERSTDGKVPNIVRTCKFQLKEYFEGKRKTFDVPLAPEGTDFQKEVWDNLLSVPFGSTSTYAKQAIKMGDLKKIRAVGSANGKNPIAIIIPCHRIIGTDGSLTGYAGGLHRKEWLLKHENSIPGYNQLKLFG
ncbi:MULTISPECIES: methylated-DNA--[protein]-cysteine S-methyltransferase [Roseivirga]|uniref:methylated-DNA--[protein]-cysteine S-methyltransferase n=1 Tax=Roseivirga TaxID=290180 RepID=UPI00257DB831|nr:MULTISPECIES: methylated-DNA--[protein]-cysteine S-methyltransferase [Roseivirga]MEC7754393.1 methylated-DNA--[protein]-cysteine S-methyltransferase [Bacteroidota bacterium]